MKTLFPVILSLLVSSSILAQHEHHLQGDHSLPIITKVAAQPLIAQAVRIGEALDFVGSSLPRGVKAALETLTVETYSEESIREVQELLDPFCLAYVDINPESRVKVMNGPAKPILMQEGWTTYLIKVHNQANITAKLVAESPNAEPILHRSTSDHRMRAGNEISPGSLDNRFVEMTIYEGRPLSSRLSGLPVQYFLLQFYTRELGQREVKLGFNVGQGSQDIGFRNTIDILFHIRKAVKVYFEVLDENDLPAMASFTITDGVDRFQDQEGIDYRARRARSAHWMERQEKKEFGLPAEMRLQGIYPLPARRLAAKNEYPDFFFQPQIYRTSGEYIFLPPGEYHINYGRGPEYLEKYQSLIVPDDLDSMAITFELDRWIHMANLGWYSADHHIHASGCSHYESPEEGVRPEDMWRQVLGEDLNMGNNLTWGPSWYHQKKYFSGE
ncbi:MAG: hypothetical protein OEQ53_22370, partial [Saprospiraceae bacterium]|nr:hypothetical protein [Saprospiraceae bacterium]